MQDIESILKLESMKTDELKSAATKLKKLPKDKVKPEMLAKVISTYQFHAKHMGEVLLEKGIKEKSANSILVKRDSRIHGKCIH